MGSVQASRRRGEAGPVGGGERCLGLQVQVASRIASDAGRCAADFQKKSLIHLLDSYRGVGNASMITKLLSLLVAKRTSRIFENSNALSDARGGFRENFQTSEHIWIL